jgi:HEPN domain-containing protein
MNRGNFQQLAQERSLDAGALLNERRYSGAYYLSGYVVECGLKAAIAKSTKRYDFPDKKAVIDSHTHSLPTLLRLAGLERRLDEDALMDSDLAVNWAVVKDWSEQSRYENVSARMARELFHAVHDPQHGVFPWLAQYW